MSEHQNSPLSAQKARDKAVVAAAKKATEDAAAAEAGGKSRAAVFAKRVLGLREEDFTWEDMRDGLKRGGAVHTCKDGGGGGGREGEAGQGKEKEEGKAKRGEEGGKKKENRNAKQKEEVGLRIPPSHRLLFFGPLRRARFTYSSPRACFKLCIEHRELKTKKKCTC